MSDKKQTSSAYRSTQFIKKTYNKNLPHALLFNGIKGIGKYKTAIEFIKTVHTNFNQLRAAFF